MPRILARDGRKCRSCGSRRHLTFHHIIPREDGGKTDERNLVTLCNRCHDLVEMGELKWVEFGFAKMEKERQRQIKGNESREIMMYRLHNSQLVFIGRRYER